MGSRENEQQRIFHGVTKTDTSVVIRERGVEAVEKVRIGVHGVTFLARLVHDVVLVILVIVVGRYSLPGLER